MIALIAALIAVQPPVSADVAGGSIDIPPPLGGSVAPYLRCTNDGINADPRMPTSTSDTMRAIVADAIAGCVEVRRRGFRSADRILRNYVNYRDRAVRHAFINGMFDQVDRMSDPLIAALARMNAPVAPTSKEQMEARC